MSFLASMAGGIGEGMQQTGDMFAKKAMVEAEHARQESLMRLGIKLELEQEETLYQRNVGREPDALKRDVTRAKEMGQVDIETAAATVTAQSQATLDFYGQNKEALMGQIRDAAELQHQVEREGKAATFNSIRDLLPKDRVDALWVQFATGIDIEPAAMKRMTEHEAVSVWMDLYDKNMEGAQADQPGFLKSLYKKGMSQEDIEKAVILMTNKQLGTAQIAAGVAKENILDGARFSNALQQVMSDGQKEGKTVEEVITMALDPNIGGIPTNRREEVEQIIRSIYHPEKSVKPPVIKDGVVVQDGPPPKGSPFAGLDSESRAVPLFEPVVRPISQSERGLLKELDRLKKDGFLEEEEYTERREKILKGRQP